MHRIHPCNQAIHKSTARKIVFNNFGFSDYWGGKYRILAEPALKKMKI